MILGRRAVVLLSLLHVFLLWKVMSARVTVTNQDNVDVYLGETAKITCEYKFTSEPRVLLITWYVEHPDTELRIRIYYGGKNLNMVDDNTEYTDRISVISEGNASQLIIRDVQLSDNRNFFCEIDGLEVGHGEKRTTLRVFAPPQHPIIRATPIHKVKNEHQLSEVAHCEVHHGFPQPNITWYINGEPLASENTLVDQKNLSYHLQSTLECQSCADNVNALITCEVSYFVPGHIRKTMSKSVKICVEHTNVELWKEAPKGLVQEGDTVQLRCHGDGTPPERFIFTREREPNTDFQSNADVLILPAVSRDQSGIYHCHPLGSEPRGELHLTVHFLDLVEVVSNDPMLLMKGGSLNATCHSQSTLETTTVWYQDGRLVGQGTTLLLKNTTYEETGEYTCEVSALSLPSLRTNGSVHIIVQGAPEIPGVEEAVELAKPTGTTVDLDCEVQGYPIPNISWIMNNSQACEEVVSKQKLSMTKSTISLQVMQNTKVLCYASNVFGTVVKTFYILATPKSMETSRVSLVAKLAIYLGGFLGIVGSVLLLIGWKRNLWCFHDLVLKNAVNEDAGNPCLNIGHGIPLNAVVTDTHGLNLSNAQDGDV